MESVNIPGVLCGNIYAVASTKPTDRNTLDFLTWIQSEGQQFLNSSGFSILASSERNSNIEELNRYQLLAKDEHWVGTWALYTHSGNSYFCRLFTVQNYTQKESPSSPVIS